MRELRNVIERACILADGEFVTERELAVCLPPPLPVAPAAAAAHASAASAVTADTELLVNVERDHIQRALVRAGGNKKAAAQMLGLSRRALYRRLERLDLSGDHRAAPALGAGRSVVAAMANTAARTAGSAPERRPAESRRARCWSSTTRPSVRDADAPLARVGRLSRHARGDADEALRPAGRTAVARWRSATSACPGTTGSG